MKDTELGKKKKVSFMIPLRHSYSNTISRVSKANTKWHINSSIGDEILERMMWHDLLIELAFISMKYIKINNVGILKLVLLKTILCTKGDLICL